MTGKGQPREGRHRDLYLVFDEPEPVPGYTGPPSRGRVMSDCHNFALTEALAQRLFPADAAAIASDVMTTVMKRWDVDNWFLSDEGSRKSWSCQAALHLIMDRKKAARRELRREPEVGREMEHQHSPSADSDREQYALDYEMAIARAEHLLSPRERRVLDHTAAGYTPAEIAEEIGSTPNSVSQDLQRIYTTLRVALTGHAQKRGRPS